MPIIRIQIFAPLICLMLAKPVIAASNESSEFFEKRIRPVLVAECYKCHSDKRAKAGLRLDYRDGLLQGGDSGPAIVPGNPELSLLLKAIRHEIDDQKMPKDGAPLSSVVIADFENWIKAGAFDPRELPAGTTVKADEGTWEATREFRKQWWSFQPIRKPHVPLLPEGNAPNHPIDRLVMTKLKENGLTRSNYAERRLLIRRIHFALTGLPPTPEQIDESLRRPWRTIVDELLASKRFGERWARHWMDWMRFAESHGSEGDAVIPSAYRYRDYLIRALNADVPYDQLVREHIAGDLLKQPRVDEAGGLNESKFGLAHYRMVQHGFQPTDPLDELVRFTDDQIDVVSKAFMGLTVSCARCHNHKFDPISQKDYYAWFGIFRSSLPAMVTVDTSDRLKQGHAEMQGLKKQIRDAVAREWLKFAESVPALLNPDKGLLERLKRINAGDDPIRKQWDSTMKAATEGNLENPLFVFKRLNSKSGLEFRNEWRRLVEQFRKAKTSREQQLTEGSRPAWDLRGAQYQSWFSNGIGWGKRPDAAGAFAVSPSGNTIVQAIYPAGVFTHLLSSKHSGVMTSPRFRIESDAIAIHLMGGDFAQARLVVQNYPIPRGGIYAMKAQPNHEEPFWYVWDTTYWKGEEAHIELATFDDVVFFNQQGNTGHHPHADDGRSWIGVTEVRFIDKGKQRPPDTGSPVAELLAGREPKDADDLAVLYIETLNRCIAGWRAGQMTDSQALFLNFFVKQKLLPNELASLESVKLLVESYRRLEAAIPVPTRSPGVMEAVGINQPLLQRGNHKQPGEPVPRRFLEAIDATPYRTSLSGRLQLAEDLLRPDNPLTARVIVNRVWHHLFGEGLVRSPDNFGRLGETPTHSELLDYLATWFVENGWSLKKLIHHIVTSGTWQQDSKPSPRSQREDPGNRLWSHFPVRRLEAESIRDTLLAVSGQLDDRMYGPGVNGDAVRRSVYVRVRRNSLDPFLNAFDAPEPLSTRGKRDVTNVPAQSLALMNDPFVRRAAERWAQAVRTGAKNASPDQLIERMYLEAFGRLPTVEEKVSAGAYLQEIQNRSERVRRQMTGIREEVSKLRREMNVLSDPVRKVLLANKGRDGDVSNVPKPFARWDFEKDANDSVRGLKGILKGGARLEKGALVVNGRDAFLETEVIRTELRAKTLEAWVQLDTFEQRGGGAITLQALNGVVFDSIVFAERRKGAWMAGSDGFRRTKEFNGSPEWEASQRPVHLAIVYGADGRITGYRDGRAYGDSYQSSGPIHFKAGQAVVSFGVRHLPPGGNRMLEGRIVEARLYDRALTPGEIAASAKSLNNYVSEEDVIRSLTSEQRRQYNDMKGKVAALETKLSKLEEFGDAKGKDPLIELAHAIFNFKEFIYVR